MIRSADPYATPLIQPWREERYPTGQMGSTATITVTRMVWVLGSDGNTEKHLRARVTRASPLLSNIDRV